ncbi:MAG: peptidoglycan editing factor PgeF [Holosporales bacterium]|jgi:YfiH family protein|nr:peptidoglycan editing factor PgeF [Holosporales bacterium]
MSLYKTSSLFPPGIVYGFFGRNGGVSAAPYDTLNTSFLVGDDTNNVLCNRQRVLQALRLGDGPLATVCQVHGTDVLYVKTPQEAATALKTDADALITDVPGIALGIQTADCAPILLYDPQKHRIAAIHAGWKGAFLGIAEKTVQALIEMGSDSAALVAAIGPCIYQQSYSVSAGFRRQFLEKDTTYEVFFHASTAEDFLFDLPGFVLSRLRAIGVEAVDVVQSDTYMDPSFFSFRRAKQETNGVCGRQLSVIALAN